MKNLFKLATYFVCLSVLILSSCKKEEGCTDPTAMNYSSDAEEDNGTCIHAYDLAQGTWNITPNCEDINLPIIGPISLDTILPESIDVQGAGNGSLFIDINGAQISGDIDNSGNITVAEQTVSIDLGLGIPIPVQISGSGKIESENSGYMDLNFSVSIAPIPISCHTILTK